MNQVDHEREPSPITHSGIKIRYSTRDKLEAATKAYEELK